MISNIWKNNAPPVKDRKNERKKSISVVGALQYHSNNYIAKPNK